MSSTATNATREVRVRIAPSPSGNLHVGTARTALFNYLYARGHQGKFILRIEDTDQERTFPEFEQNIYDSLNALGLTIDEGPNEGGPYGPYKQSQRQAIYREWVEKLLAGGHAYPCYLTKAELDAERQAAQEAKRPYVYSGRCRDAAVREEMARDPNRTPVVRFRIPDNCPTLVVQDHVRGTVSFDPALIGDFVIQKSDGTPTYNFAVVVDDITMKISHVIRGEDHLPNTPKQVLIYQALNEPLPEFAHVGMILSPDKSKLSKRYGATAVSDYIQQGYFPEAFCNFLALLGWAPPDGEEVGTIDHFAAQFELSRIAQSPAVFDMEKLNFLNSRMIRALPLNELKTAIQPHLGDLPLDSVPEEKQNMMLDAVREPVTVLSEFPDALRYFFGQDVAIEEQTRLDALSTPEAATALERFETDFLSLADFSAPEALATQLSEFTKSLKPMKPKTAMWAVRAALTGRTHGADLSRVLYILGRETVTHRVQAARRLTASQAV
ncbi:MAG: glutamate--tRNA ligase [Candidatus Melainabacteria bacterium]